MNRKHKTLKWGIALVSSMLTLNLSAQSSLIDYQSDKVDLGMGVELDNGVSSRQSGYYTAYGNGTREVPR